MICDYKECNNEFKPKTHNQKYCSDECCKIATNLKIKEKYYYKKARMAGVPFKCETKSCKNILNRYTTDLICEECRAKEKTKNRNELLEMLNGN